MTPFDLSAEGYKIERLHFRQHGSAAFRYSAVFFKRCSGYADGLPCGLDEGLGVACDGEFFVGGDDDDFDGGCCGGDDGLGAACDGVDFLVNLYAHESEGAAYVGAESGLDSRPRRR